MQKYLLNKKTIILDIILISVAIVGIAFASSWIYSNILAINGQEPQLILSSNAGPNPVTNQTFTLTAILSLSQNPLAGKTITFFEDDVSIGTAVTDINGNALLPWIVKSGVHQYKAGLEVV